MNRLSCSLGLGAALLTLTLAGVAHAKDDAAGEADRLFTEAKALTKAGAYAEACPKLARSLDLDPAIGTEFNLADCLEHVGKKSSAWRHYENVERTAHATGKGDREQAAAKRREALRASLGWLALAVPKDTTVLELTVDDESLDPRSVRPGQALPADPGTHRVAIRPAVGAAWTGEATVTPGETVTLTPVFSEPESTSAPAAAAPVPAKPGERSERGSGRRTAAVIVGAVGVAGLGVGGAAGIFSIASNGTAKKQCDPTSCDSAEGIESWRRATTSGTISTIGLAAGGALVAVAVVLWVTAPKPASRTAQASWDLQGLHF